MPRNRIIPIFVPHVGCPHQCVFCNQKRIAGSGTPLTPEAVASAVGKGLERSGTGAEVAFYGGSFTAIPALQQMKLLEAVQPWLRSGAVSSVRLSTRPDAVDEETVNRLRRYGVNTVELGSQSMDDAVLRLAERGHTAKDTARAVALLKSAGIQVILQMMTGLPGSTRESDLETASRLIGLHPDGVRIYPTVVVRDTKLCELYRNGTYQPQTVEEAVTLCAELYQMFAASGVPVLRMGLQPTEELKAGTVAGPYHPAFGELVKSRILLQKAVSLLETTEADVATLLVRKDRISAMVGQHRENLRILQERFPEKSIFVAAGTCEEWEIRLQSDEKPDTIT